jgi:ubiquinone/menaquinone biosynthesis C-methylase UbiE
LTSIFEDIGFEKVRYRSMTNGIAVAHVGIKASRKNKVTYR